MIAQYEYARIAEYITSCDLPRKEQKLAGLQRAEMRGISMSIIYHDEEAMILLNGVAIDPSELENGYWL